MFEKGMVYWLTGLSGAGKTTVGTLMFEYLKTIKDNIILLDGDVMRQIVGNFDYTMEGRDKQTKIIQRMLQLLSNQGIDVICCVIGMNEGYRRWNRKNLEKYAEIYLEVSMDELVKRDSKGLYKAAMEGKQKNVYGIDYPIDYPHNPELIIKNQGENDPQKALQMIIERFDLDKLCKSD